jgi:pimeloyl-ACP methyl ester carboxylesterase
LTQEDRKRLPPALTVPTADYYKFEMHFRENLQFDVVTGLEQSPQPKIINTVRGAVEVAEFGEGPAVLCLHGAMGGYDQGLILARTLGEPGYHYVALSRPGYLRTPISRGRAPKDQADLYAAALDALGIERAAVMAVSGGGPSAMHFALQYPSRCTALVLVSTVAGPVPNRLPFAFKLMKLFAHLPLFEWKAKRKTAKNSESLARRSIADEALLKKTRENAEAWALFKELQMSTVHQMKKRLVGTENDVEVTRTQTYPLEKIAVPTLVVHGTSDPLVPIDQHGTVLAERIPGAEIMALSNGGHAAIFSYRDEARARAMEFLRRNAR